MNNNKKVDFKQTFNFYKGEIIVLSLIIVVSLFFSSFFYVIDPTNTNYSQLVGVILGVIILLFPFIIDYFLDESKFWFFKDEDSCNCKDEK